MFDTTLDYIRSLDPEYSKQYSTGQITVRPTKSFPRTTLRITTNERWAAVALTDEEVLELAVWLLSTLPEERRK